MVDHLWGGWSCSFLRRSSSVWGSGRVGATLHYTRASKFIYRLRRLRNHQTRRQPGPGQGHAWTGITAGFTPAAGEPRVPECLMRRELGGYGSW
jgi:hypothetical protein